MSVTEATVTLANVQAGGVLWISMSRALLRFLMQSFPFGPDVFSHACFDLIYITMEMDAKFCEAY